MDRRRSTYVMTVATVSVLMVVALLSLAKLVAAQSSSPDPNTGLTVMSMPLPPIGDGQPANAFGTKNRAAERWS